MLLRAIAAMRRLAPQSRRRDWYRQWRADVWHESQWVSRTRGRQPQAATALAVKVAGAARHALWLRFYVRRLEMISHDLRYGWRLMVRRPGFTVIAILMLGAGDCWRLSANGWEAGNLAKPFASVCDCSPASANSFEFLRLARVRFCCRSLLFAAFAEAMSLTMSLPARVFQVLHVDIAIALPIYWSLTDPKNRVSVDV
ncbi:MAG TPA: hypothetical protein VI485_01720 [Vicinamibacterales bacterium]|nr:hypothetical protein [Vicinamibacterales bacterium]